MPKHTRTLEMLDLMLGGTFGYECYSCEVHAPKEMLHMYIVKLACKLCWCAQLLSYACSDIWSVPARPLLGRHITYTNAHFAY